MTTLTEARATDTKITHAVVLVTPDMAQRWLDGNNHQNRDISELRWRGYSADMREGRWNFNGETIQFDWNGELQNGQHRLLAIVDCGLAQTFLIVRGLDPDAKLTMDQGTRRQPKDQLKLAGVVADTVVAAAIRVFIRWDRGLLFGDQVGRKVSTSEIVAWAQKHPRQVERMSAFSARGAKRIKCRPSVALAVALRFSLIDPDGAEEFIDGLIHGAGLPVGSPVYVLRERLKNDHDRKVKVTERDEIGLFVTAWNAWRDGREITKLQRPRGGAWSIETFPEPR